LSIPGRIDIRSTREEFNEREGFMLALFADIAKKYPVQVVWPASKSLQDKQPRCR
jgi:hypothetical protein